jgi:hypothetical protein
LSRRYRRAYAAEGIPLNDETLAGIHAAGRKLGIATELVGMADPSVVADAPAAI